MTYPHHPLEQPIERLLAAIENFDGGSGRSGETAREVRSAMQHLVSVAEIDGAQGSDEVRAMLPRQVLYATGWSSQTLSDIHRDLQLVMQRGPDPMV